MITVKNETNQSQYEVLFQAATNDLVKASMANPEGVQFRATFEVIDIDADDYVNNPGRYFVKDGEDYEFATGDFSADTTYYVAKGIQTLEDFFCHLGDLYNLNPKYIMLPLDEEPFEINANTREITVPKAFQKGVTVQGDILAETLLFTIDRFFDAVDLGHESMNIYAQWEHINNPAQKFVTPLNHTHYDLIDMESEHGKIIFGWPLSEDIAKNPGQIKFSIRFLKYDGTRLVYSFSTKAATISIIPGLDYNVNDAQSDAPSNLFDAVITNSETTTGPSAVRPVYETNLDVETSYLDADGTAELSVKARAADGGDIWYEWYFSKDKEAIGTKVAGEHPEAGQPSTFIVDGTEKDIVGFYWAKAINKLGNHQKTVQSKTTEFPGANVPTFKTQPADTILIDGKANLAVEMNADSHGEHNTVSYQWKNGTKVSEMIEIEGATAATLEVEAPGYYLVTATNTVNRDSESYPSNSCVVYEQPGAVVFTPLESANLAKGQKYTLTVTKPTSEFALGEISYALYIDYTAIDAEGILVDGQLPETAVEYMDLGAKPEFTVTSDMILAAAGSAVRCIAKNAIRVGEVDYITYSESTPYFLVN